MRQSQSSEASGPPIPKISSPAATWQYPLINGKNFQHAISELRQVASQLR